MTPQQQQHDLQCACPTDDGNGHCKCCTRAMLRCAIEEIRRLKARVRALEDQAASPATEGTHGR